MLSSKAVTRPSISSIDELLGDSRTRFFGAGFRLVRHEVTDLVVDTSQKTVRANARIDYPASWSAKKSRELKPHLSSLDALTIGAQLCEVLVRTAFGIEGDAADRLWLSSSSFKAGNNPTTDLAVVPASCTLVETKSAPDSLCGHRSSFTAQVASIGLEFAIDHPIVDTRNVVACWADVKDVLGPPENRYFGSAYAVTQLDLRDIKLDTERVNALLDLEELGGRRLHGMGAAYFPFVSPANMIVCMGQLSQAMLYHYDNISRDVSHNLWMRKIVLEHPMPAVAGRGLHVATWSTKMSLVSIKEAMWRTANFALTMPGIVGTYTLAHQLPAERQLVDLRNEGQ
jgi:hypothetical protein